MFSVGMSPAANTFFAVSTGLVAVPTGIKIFNWLGTMWGGRIRLRTPMLFAIAVLLQFLVAGITGVMLAVVPFNWQLTDTYFVVAHFHFVLVGSLLFAIFGAVYYWYPKATGRMLSERLGKWHFWLFLIGFNLTFIPQHFAGMLGMPRRVYTFLPERGLEIWNLVSSLGVAFQVVGAACFAWNLIRSYRRGAVAGNDPWDAWTLEWATSSPPPVYNFAELPVVGSRRPLWDLKHPEDPDWHYE
jgi:cytochrome c oxidase subunit I